MQQERSLIGRLQPLRNVRSACGISNPGERLGQRFIGGTFNIAYDATIEMLDARLRNERETLGSRDTGHQTLGFDILYQCLDRSTDAREHRKRPAAAPYRSLSQ